MVSKLSVYDVIRAPIFSEKSTSLSALDSIVLEVCMTASKAIVKRAVESLFKVNVVRVNTHVRKGKVKRFRGIYGVRKSFKIAVVTLKPGQAVDASGSL